MWTFGVFLGLLSMDRALGTRAFLSSPLSVRLPLMASAPSPMPWWQSSVAGGCRLCFSVLVREFCFVKLWGLHLGSVVHQSLPQPPQKPSSTWVRSSVGPLLGPGTRALTGNSEVSSRHPPTTLRPCIATNKQTNTAKPSNNSKMVPSVWTVFSWFSVCVVTVNFFSFLLFFWLLTELTRSVWVVDVSMEG